MKKKRQPAWQPLVPAKTLTGSDGVVRPVPTEVLTVWINDLYSVWVRDSVGMSGGLYAKATKPYLAANEAWCRPEALGKIRWLSIKRNDRQPIHDWRDLQEIKNQLAGPEIMAVEIYPKESNLQDSANQYHLWCLMDGSELPFGIQGRFVTEHPERFSGGENSIQRPFRKGKLR